MIRMLVPLLVFVGLLVLLIVGLQSAEQRKEIASPLIGKPLPALELPGLHSPEIVRTSEELKGQPWVLNVWGSWCWACRAEHPFIERLGREAGVPLIGFNWKDERGDALTWLDRFGDAWTWHMVDFEGRSAIDLGVYGAPETFLIDHEGIIRHKHIGPIDATSFADLMRRIVELRTEART